MVLQRWDPFRDLMDLRRTMDRIWEEAFGRSRRLLWAGEEGEGLLTMDMYQTADKVVVKASLPGVKPEDVNITISGDQLTLKGEFKETAEAQEGNYLLRERRSGAFSRTVTLPQGLNVDKAEASFENGVLTLTIPKAEELKPKEIKVKVK